MRVPPSASVPPSPVSVISTRAVPSAARWVKPPSAAGDRSRTGEALCRCTVGCVPTTCPRHTDGTAGASATGEASSARDDNRPLRLHQDQPTFHAWEYRYEYVRQPRPPGSWREAWKDVH